MTLRKMTAILLAALVCALVPAGTGARADDAELAEIIPGRWTVTDEVQEEGEEIRTADIAFVTFGKDGTAALEARGEAGETLWSCAGEWAFELVEGGLDLLRITWTETNNPAWDGKEYRAACVYSVYAESWVENDTEVVYLLLEETEEGNGETPFTEVAGYDSTAMHREQGPNMRVVNCKSYVSLRAGRSASAARLKKVPLGAAVLAWPEEGTENGFIRCVYEDTDGYILAEYLEPLE